VFRKAAAPEYEAHTHAVRARALLALGNVPGAEAEVRQARARSGQVIAPEVRYMVALAEGRVRDAVGDREGAARSLKATADEARGAGLKTYELEARLALGELAVRAGRAESGRALLRAVESEATSRGLGLLARQAATYAR
jgi:hypothetical protein